MSCSDIIVMLTTINNIEFSAIFFIKCVLVRNICNNNRKQRI